MWCGMFLVPLLISSWFSSHTVKLSSVEINPKEMFLIEIRFLFPLRGSSGAYCRTMNPIHQIWKMTQFHVMLDREQFTQHMHSWISTPHKVAVRIMHSRQAQTHTCVLAHTHTHTHACMHTRSQPMPCSAFPRNSKVEKSPLCLHPKERNTHQQLRKRGKNRAFSGASLSQQIFQSHQGSGTRYCAL